MDADDQITTSFTGGRAPSPNDVFIAVMGVTGSGKSSFISLCSGKAVKVGHQLEACTSYVDVYAYDVSASHTIYLIDTPGFDDTNRSDTHVLREIAGWLGASYKSKILLHGIIYLHRITDIRMQGSARKNLIMFRQLCGDEALKKVILVTTMWDKVQKEEAIRRERQLIDTPEFWGWMLGKGSRCHRHDNTVDSARGIVSRLSGHKAPIATDLQRQLVDEHLSLEQTSAGRELQSELLKERERWAREKLEIEKQMEEAIKKHDRDAEEMMREERDRYTKMIKKVENDTGTLRLTMNNLLAERDKRVERMEQQMKTQQAAHKLEIERLNDRQRRIEKEKEELEKLNRQREKEKNRQTPPHQSYTPSSNFPIHATRISFLDSLSLKSGYSLTINNSTFMNVGPREILSNFTHPEQKRGTARVLAASVGDADQTSKRVWVAGYSNGTWIHSQSLGDVYPDLAACLKTKGQNNLALCCLGPAGAYYARWRNLGWRSQAPEEINKKISEAQSNGCHIEAISFGFGGSYVISYGSRTPGFDWIKPGIMWNLKGYYPHLKKFFDEKQITSITAIALDINGGADYQMVYKTGSRYTENFFTRNISSESWRSRIDEWWRNS